MKKYEIHPAQLGRLCLAELALERLMRGDSPEDTRDLCRCYVVGRIGNVLMGRKNLIPGNVAFPNDEILADNHEWVEKMVVDAIQAAEENVR